MDEQHPGQGDTLYENKAVFLSNLTEGLHSIIAQFYRTHLKPKGSRVKST